MKTVKNKKKYTIFGYNGRQVRDNIHSYDVASLCFHISIGSPRYGEVYNLGGGKHNSCSVLEALEICRELTGLEGETEYIDVARQGDHKWWITNTNKIYEDYPLWTKKFCHMRDIIQEQFEA